tara:strand:+ start:3399 stop:3545 length:147 start_codon:yes stop_codon:yes gene_type:complete
MGPKKNFSRGKFMLYITSHLYKSETRSVFFIIFCLVFNKKGDRRDAKI